MKRYTKADVEKFRHDEFGNLICPKGDYSQIHSFGARCSFGAGCSFGKGCSFGEGCSFGGRISFGAGCSFGKECSFGNACSFGAGCSFGKVCSFGEGCSFGERCSFGEGCYFGKGCNFEDERVKSGEYFACDRIGSERRKTYFFRDGDGNMFVRAGCWFSPLYEFVERVKEAHGGTKYEKEYLAAVELAKIVLER